MKLDCEQGCDKTTSIKRDFFLERDFSLCFSASHRELSRYEGEILLPYATLAYRLKRAFICMDHCSKRYQATAFSALLHTQLRFCGERGRSPAVPRQLGA